MADASGGRYLPAADAKALNESLRAAVVGKPERFIITDSNARKVAEGDFGDSVKLPEGRYLLRCQVEGTWHETSFWVLTDETTSVVFDVAALRSR